jgi:hypothetical protein
VNHAVGANATEFFNSLLELVDAAGPRLLSLAMSPDFGGLTPSVDLASRSFVSRYSRHAG